MSDPDQEATGERFMRFHDLYKVVIKTDFDPLEFAEDDLYAFQVLDRAFRSDDQELRNLAAHLQTQREAALETITLRAAEISEQTRRLKTLELKVLERRGDSGDLSPMIPAAALDQVASGSLDINLDGPPAPAGGGGPDDGASGRRRKGWF
jgi:hypothetical protein